MKFFREILQVDQKIDYLSKENTVCLKGILAIAILIHHLYQHSGILRGNPIGYILQAMGYWVVGIFFFLSGYGLMTTWKNRGKQWIRSFASQKILPYYCTCVMMILVYTIYIYWIRANW